MLKVVVANRPGAGYSALASALNQWFNLECETLNIPSEILYETSNVIQPDIYILNKGYEGYEGIIIRNSNKKYGINKRNSDIL